MDTVLVLTLRQEKYIGFQELKRMVKIDIGRGMEKL